MSHPSEKSSLPVHPLGYFPRRAHIQPAEAQHEVEDAYPWGPHLHCRILGVCLSPRRAPPVALIRWLVLTLPPLEGHGLKPGGQLQKDAFLMMAEYFGNETSDSDTEQADPKPPKYFIVPRALKSLNELLTEARPPLRTHLQLLLLAGVYAQTNKPDALLEILRLLSEETGPKSPKSAVLARVIKAWNRELLDRHVGVLDSAFALSSGYLREELLDRWVSRRIGSSKTLHEIPPSVCDEIDDTRGAGAALQRVLARRDVTRDVSTVHLVRQQEDPLLQEKEHRRLLQALKQPLSQCTGKMSPLEVRSELAREFPWASATIERLLNRWTAKATAGSVAFTLPPSLIVGPPGVGKTRLATRLCELAGVPYRMLSAAGANSSMMLKGSEKAWSNATPSLVTEMLKEWRIANPVLIVDEIDKDGHSDQNGRLSHVLLSMTEKENSRCFWDPCLTVEIDISHVNWLLTANELEPILYPLRSRLQVLKLDGPRHEDVQELIQRIIRDCKATLGLPAEGETDLVDFAESLERAVVRSDGPVSARKITQIVERKLDALMVEWAKQQRMSRH